MADARHLAAEQRLVCEGYTSRNGVQESYYSSNGFFTYRPNEAFI
jgi:hypothetical protein